MHDILDLETFPLHDLTGAAGRALVERCRGELAEMGMFDLAGLIRPQALHKAVEEVAPLFAEHAFTHARRHNIYFKDRIDGLPADHPALRICETVNHTLCADQIAEAMIVHIYEWPPLANFLAAVMGKPELHAMADPLARVNVMAYREGEALNWHFDRSEFTTTVLLQAPEGGGEFQYRSDLRSDADPNYDGVARLLEGDDGELKTLALKPGTLNVFRGRNTAHRVTPVEGARERILAVYSYYEQPGVVFSQEERIGFYGRAA